MNLAPEQSGAQGPPRTVTVAKIISSAQIILNAGATQGVTVGTRYRIIRPVEIHDPDDPGADPIVVEYIKGIVEVTQVLERVSVGTAPEIPAMPSFASLAHATKLIRPDLNVDARQVTLGAEDLKIRVGDKARLDQK